MTRYKLRPADWESKKILFELEGVKSIAPLDAYLGIDKLPFKVSAKMMLECAYWAQNQVSYDKAEECISRIYRQFINDDTIRLITNFIGRSVFDSDCKKAEDIWLQFNKRPFYQSSSASADTLYLEIDGSAVNTRTQDENGSTWRENKLAIIFKSSDIYAHANKKGEMCRIIRNREYISLIGTVSEFKKHVLRGAVGNGYPNTRRLVILSDGAEWIFNMVDELFGSDSGKVIHILDYFHLSENVYDYAKAKFNNIEEKYIPWAKQINDDLKIGKWQDVLKKLNPKETYKGTVNLYHYISSHSANIDYPRYQSLGLFIGSGAIESANKKIVQARLKQAGMRWGVETAQNLITLVAKEESHLWERDVSSFIYKQLGCK